MIQQENTSTRLVSSDPSPVSTSLLSTLVSGKGSHKDKVLPLKHPVRQALEKYATVIGPLDASQVINELEDDNLCLFFSYYKELQILHLKNWSNLSFPVIRTMCMTFGENLRELDVSSSLINSSHIELLLAYSHDLKIIRLDNCPQVDANAIKNIVKLSYRTLQELYLVNCKKLNTEAFQLIGGYVGNISKNMAKNKTALSRTSHSLSLSSISNPNPNSYIPPSLSSPLTKLKALDLTNTSLNDNGLLSIAYGCKNIVFLNICDCFNITDKSLTNLIENNKKIQLLNCKNCKNITNLSAKYIGKYLNNLMSLNLSYCSNITDVGIKMISQGCLKLQAVNLIYLNQITDLSLFHLVTNCKILMYLNITGCEQITVNGVKNLIMGLPYVELSKSYLGFKPIDNYLEKKLEDCLNMIEYNQIQEINKQLLAQELKEEQELEIYNNLLNKSASIIQGAIFRYTKRLFFYNIWQSKLKTSSTITIQRIYRGYRGRLESHKRRKDVEKFYALSPFALKIQKHVRGHLSRVKISHNSANQDNEQVSLVSQTIREMYFIRKKEVENAIAVRLQAIFRGFLTRLHFRVYKKLDKRHKSHLHSAAIIIQCLIRSFLAKNLFKKLKLNKKNEEEAIRIASLKIKLFCVAGMKRYKSRLQGDELKRFFREKWTAAIEIQRFYRGYYAREAVNIMLINKAIEYKAATLIQKVWRGSRVLHWKAQRLNLLAGFVLDRHYNERKAAVNSSRKRWIEFIRETRHDSASEEEDENQENEYPYIEYFDTGRKQKYWVNYLTNETTYDEPPIPFAHELDLIGKRIKIFWTVQGTWYEGTIGDFKKKKKKHLVNYDDGDHEWIILENEADRVQIQLPDGTWSMYIMYQSQAAKKEIQKLQDKKKRDDLRKQAIQDAKQWKPFHDDISNKTFFISTITGEIRSASVDGHLWRVELDASGFPCFINEETNQVEYEDPRFSYEISEDLIQQRNFVMQELRLALYICNNFIAEYNDLVNKRDGYFDEDTETYVKGNGNQKAVEKVLIKIAESPTPYHLTSFLLRARELYKRTCVSDKVLDRNILDELDYINEVNKVIQDLCDEGRVCLIKKHDKIGQLFSEFAEKSNVVVYCRYCKRETKKHLDFCPNCGKPQVFI